MYVKRWLRRYRGEIRIISTFIVIVLLFGIYTLIRKLITNEVQGSTLSSNVVALPTSEPTHTPVPSLIVPTTIQINIYINNTTPIYNQIYSSILTQIPTVIATQVPTSIPSATQIPTAIPTYTPYPTYTSMPTPVPTTVPLISSFIGKYFNNLTLSGEPVLTRIDEDIHFNWVKDAPHPNLSKDEFSVRWEGNINSEAAEYNLKISHDDGMRIYIDNSLIYDSWKNQGAYPRSIIINLTEGIHDIIIEYYDKAYEAVAYFSIEKL